MTPQEIREARQSLGLNQRQMGEMLETDSQTVSRMEMAETASTFRRPAQRMERLIRAYLAGYRPDDWPVDTSIT